MSERVHCLTDVCLTCSDEARPALVLRLQDDALAIVEIDGAREQVSVALVEAAVGDTVLVHAKETIAVITRGSGDEPAEQAPTAHEGIDRLYPFLSAGRAADPDHRGDAAADHELTGSTAVKAAEIVRLRAQVAELYTDRLAECAEAMAVRFAAGGRLFTFGNGGSSTDAQEVATAYLHPGRGRPLPALSLTTDVAVVTALSNDVGFEVVFARQLAALGRPGDIALGLSTSGGSANLVQAFQQARRRDMLTVGMAGYQGGKLAELAELGVLDYLFVIPSSSVHRIQEAQTTVYHVLWEVTQHVLGTVPRASETSRR